MTLLPLRVTQPFRDYKHGDLIDTEDDVMFALEHHPHLVVQVDGEVKPSSVEPPVADTTDAKPTAKARPTAK